MNTGPGSVVSLADRPRLARIGDDLSRVVLADLGWWDAYAKQSQPGDVERDLGPIVGELDAALVRLSGSGEFLKRHLHGMARKT